MMLRNVLIGLPAMLLCVAMQAVFAFWSVRYYVRHPASRGRRAGTIVGIRPLLVAMLTMMLGTVIQIVLWGLLFIVLGEFNEAYEAIYHSAVNFASLGYGDIVMSKQWKMLG